MSAYWLALLLAIAATLYALESYRFEKSRSLDKCPRRIQVPPAWTKSRPDRFMRIWVRTGSNGNPKIAKR